MQEHSWKEIIKLNFSIDGKRNFGDRYPVHLKAGREPRDNLAE